MRRRVTALLKLALGVALIAWLLSQLDFAELARLSRAGDVADLLLGLGAFVVALAGFQALRLHVLVRRHTGSLSTSYKLFFVGALFNNLLPSNVGGDAVRLLYLRDMGGGVGGPLALLLLHRLTGLGVLLVGATFYVLARPARALGLLAGGEAAIDPGTALLVVLAGLVVGSLLLMLGLRLQRVRKLLADAAGAVRSLSWSDWAALLLLTGLFQAARLVGFLFIARYLGQLADPFDTIFVLAAAAVAALLPISIAGLGVMEGSISYLFVAFGMDPAAAISAAFAHRLALLLMALVGGVVYGLSRGRPGPEAPVEASGGT